MAGIRNTVPLADLEQIDKRSYDELLEIMRTLEEHYRDLCDIEFTIERGKLWMLQTRVGKRTAAAAFRIATQLVDQGLIDMDEALQRVTGAQLAQLMFPRFDDTVGRKKIAQGMNASPGAAVGEVVFDSYTAVKWSRSGEKVILVRRETNPDDLDGMIAAPGHPDLPRRQDQPRGGRRPRHGQDLRLRGRVARRRHQGPAIAGSRVASRSTRATSSRSTARPARCSSARCRSSTRRWCSYFEGELDPDSPDTTTWSRRFDRLMRHADGMRRMAVRANADTAEDAARARRFGAQGIGLCRTEHMFLGERRALVERLILADTDEERDRRAGRAASAAARGLRRHPRGDGRTAGHDPAARPAAARVPARHHRAVGAGGGRRGPRRARGRTTCGCCRPCTSCTSRTRCSGCAASGSAWSFPGCSRCSRGRSCEAAAERIKAGGVPRVEIMVPLVANVQEFETVKQDIIQVARDVRAETGVHLEFLVGTMIELPRAALTADQIAEAAEFFSFGTNDLTQTTWGFSRDDVEAAFFSAYLEKGIFGISPFESIDRRRRRRARPRSAPRRAGQASRPQARRLRRARRRPRLGPLLRRGRPGLRVLLAVPGSGRPTRGGPGQHAGRRRMRPDWERT